MVDLVTFVSLIFTLFSNTSKSLAAVFVVIPQGVDER